MIIKTISKIKIHIFFYIMITASIFTGHFKDFFLFVAIILFHELGHIIAGMYYKWEINKIMILPFGALTIFDTPINKPFKEEFIVSVMGFVFQFILYFFLRQFNINNLYILNYGIFLFNLFPINPLDGSKILNSILNLIFPFKTSYLISIVISIIFIVSLLMFKNLILYLTIVFLLIRIIKEIKNKKYMFLKFLLERKKINLKSRKNKIIKGENLNKIFKYYKNLFYIDKIYYTEKEVLNKKFDFY